MSSAYIGQLAFNKEFNASNHYERLSFGAQNVERILVELDFSHDYTAWTSGLHATQNSLDCFISVLAGNNTIVNRIPAWMLATISQQENGTGIPSTTEMIFEIDCGIWSLLHGSEILVNIDCPNTDGTQKVTATVHAEVNGILPPDPQRMLYRTDNAFMIEGVSKLWGFKTDGSTAEEAQHNVDMTYGGETISQPISGLAAVCNVDTVGDAKVNAFVVYDGAARDIQVNVPSTGYAFIGVTDVKVSQETLVRQTSFIRKKLNSFSLKERSYNKNK